MQLDREPMFVEARIRYGRILTLLDRADDAVKELRRAAAGAGDPLLDYFAQLFLARRRKPRTGGMMPAARERAAALAPEAQSPRLSLSQPACAPATARRRCAHWNRCSRRRPSSMIDPIRGGPTRRRPGGPPTR